MSTTKSVSIITDEGRIIFETIKSPSTEYQGSPKVNDQGQRVQDQAVTLAFPKNGPWQETPWGKAIMEAADLNFPAHSRVPDFRYGVMDGDQPRVDRKTGQLVEPKPYQKGHWLLLASSAQQLAGDRGIDVLSAATATPIPATAWKCGDYGHADIGILVRKDLKGMRIFLNGLAVSRPGEAIEGNRPSTQSRFQAAGFGGNAPAQGQPAQTYQQPVQNQPAQQAAAQPAQAPAGRQLVMTALAQGRSAADFRNLGMTDETMVTAGLAVWA